MPYLSKDYTSRIYKDNRDDWRKADIVVTTVQSLLSREQLPPRLHAGRLRPRDLRRGAPLHRRVTSRAVFEYFIGYKLGLTATPKDYLKKIDPAGSAKTIPASSNGACCSTPIAPSAANRGARPSATRCWTGSRTATSSIPPWWMRARTITTELLSEEGFAVE